MPLKVNQRTTPGTRHRKGLIYEAITKSYPEKSLLIRPLKKTGGRNSSGHITVRHHGGGHKRHLRLIDFKRDKTDIPGQVKAIEYDPNRSANIALIYYPDGEKRYILAPLDLQVGATIIASAQAEIQPGNSLPLKNIPIGTPVHNLEIVPGKGGQLVRSAGNAAFIQAKENNFVTVQLPSKEIRLINDRCRATIGQLGNVDVKNVKFGKAGLKRHLGIRPHVRGVAMHPRAHPHGGGEGRSGVGMKSPKSPWGKRTLGRKTRYHKKYSNRYIIRDRRQK